MLALLLAIVLRFPDPTLTPGVARPLTKADICATRWGKDRRHVTRAMRRQVFAAYGIPWSQRARFEVDHVIPRQLGGADVVANIWPQPWEGRWNAHQKDVTENAVARAVCRGEMTLQFAQDQIAVDWTRLYDQLVK